MNTNTVYAVYAGNLPFNASEELLREAFSPFGNVREVRMAREPEGGHFRGFALVRMSTREEVVRAVQELGGKDIGGRRCYLEPRIVAQDLWDQEFSDNEDR